MVAPFRLTKIVVMPGAGVAAKKIEARRFLKGALEPVGDLQQGVVHRRAGPRRLHDHRLDDERRILVAAETVEGAQPGDRRRDHYIDDERAMLERPLRQVELHLGGRSEQPNLLAGMERLDAGSHDDVAGLETLGNDDRPRVVAQHFDVPHRHRQICRVDDPDGRLPLSSVSAVAGIAMTGSDANLTLPVTVAAEPHVPRAGRSDRP